MNEEIKEILEALKPQDEEFTKAGIKEYPLYLRPDQQRILLDYITNLQEKYDIAQKDIEAMKNNYNLLVRLIENGESMTQKFENGLTYQDYKSRIEKAIETISSILYNYDNMYYNQTGSFIENTIDELKELKKELSGDKE